MYIMEEFLLLLQLQPLHFQKLGTVYPSLAWCISARFAIRNVLFSSSWKLTQSHFLTWLASLCNHQGQRILCPIFFSQESKAHGVSTECICIWKTDKSTQLQAAAPVRQTSVCGLNPLISKWCLMCLLVWSSLQDWGQSFSYQGKPLSHPCLQFFLMIIIFLSSLVALMQPDPSKLCHTGRRGKYARLFSPSFYSLSLSLFKTC